MYWKPVDIVKLHQLIICVNIFIHIWKRYITLTYGERNKVQLSWKYLLMWNKFIKFFRYYLKKSRRKSANFVLTISFQWCFIYFCRYVVTNSKTSITARTDSPDNDSAFSDNVSMLSSESSASSGASGSAGSRHDAGKHTSQVGISKAWISSQEY